MLSVTSVGVEISAHKHSLSDRVLHNILPETDGLSELGTVGLIDTR
jgi:hypothetical protein